MTAMVQPVVSLIRIHMQMENGYTRKAQSILLRWLFKNLWLMNKDDNYYKHLYPLNKEQYRIVKAHYMETGDDSEEFIVKVMNDRKFKPDYWSKASMKPTIAGKGYRGGVGVDVTSRVYKRWCDMLQRCLWRRVTRFG